MTRGATHVRKTERQNLIGPRAQAYFMAVRTRNRGVRPAQRVARLPVHRHGKSRLVEILDGVAVLAPVLIRRGRELIVVGILMAVRASRKFHFVNGVFTRRQMALVAFHLDVLAPQGIGRRIMLFHSEERWFPTFHRMTFRALAFLRP